MKVYYHHILSPYRSFSWRPLTWSLSSTPSPTNRNLNLAPPSYKPIYPVYPDTPPTYQYKYAVTDDYDKLDFNAYDSRDGHTANGAYNVLLPDGLVKTVTYTVADAYSGFVADVTYSKLPPSYKPAPPGYWPAPIQSNKQAPPPLAYKPLPHSPQPPVYYKPAPLPPLVYRPTTDYPT
nr:extensin-like [Lepeophtheirus salmonis]